VNAAFPVNMAETTLEKQADHGLKTQGTQVKFRRSSSGEIQSSRDSI
jgi:hypothetical protein